MQSDLDTDVQFADADKLLGGQWIQNTEWSFIMEMSDSIGDEILYYNKDNSQFFFWDESDLDIFFIKGAEYVPNYISKEELNTLLSEREIESISEEFSSQAGPIINDEPDLTESSPEETPSWEKAGEDVYCWPREVNGRWWYYYQNPEGDFYKYIQGDFTSEKLNQEQFNDLFYS